MRILCPTFMFIFAEEVRCPVTDDDSGELMPKDKLIQVCFVEVRGFVP